VVGQHVVLEHAASERTDLGYGVTECVAFGYGVFGYGVIECVAFKRGAFGYVVGATGIGYAHRAAVPWHVLRVVGPEHTCRTPGRPGGLPARPRPAGRNSDAVFAPGRGADVRRTRPRFVVAHPADGAWSRGGTGDGCDAGRR
jgi:hypothetical protein